MLLITYILSSRVVPYARVVDEMRLDELARRAEVPTTTVRLYQNKGLLPGPRLEGRTGWYDEQHLARLGVIARLQAEGFSLAGIGRLLDLWDEGRPLADLVAGPTGAGVLSRARPVELAPEELADRFPEGALDGAAVQRAAALGLVELTDEGTLRVPDERFVTSGAALAALGVPVAAVLDQWESLRADTDRIAERFVAVFLDHVAGRPPEELTAADVPELTGPFAELRRLADEVVLAALDASLERAARQVVEPPDEPERMGR